MAEIYNPVGERLYSYGKNRTDFYGLAERMKRHDEWHMGSMWATRSTSKDHRPYGYYGQLPSEHYEKVKHADYVVWSYATPIAWETYGIWHMPDKHYSQTTTTHQGKIRTALSVME